jgi:parallel beta-helix repeat protein
MMSMIRIDDDKSKGRRIPSVFIVCILVASGLLVVFPLNLPTAEAVKYHYMGSAAMEDLDRGDGFDYNGDTVGDMKITWHAGADSPHIVNGDFVVDSDYILEIEAGAVVKIDPGVMIKVGTTLGASLYSNGTSFSSQVQFIQNVTDSPWDWLFIVNGSYAYLDYTVIDGGGEIRVSNSDLLINNSNVTNMDESGIRAIDSTISATNCFIENNNDAGIYCDSSDAIIDNNSIYGFNGTEFLNSGRGIYITGSSSSIVISNNTIFGGFGWDQSTGTFGGRAIRASNYDCRLRIVDNPIIQGGDGGDNTFMGMNAGEGGRAVDIQPVPNYSTPPAVMISNNTAIIGGKGGENTGGAEDGIAGIGAAAIWIVDNDVKGGEIVISENENIIGGEGGDNYASSTFMFTASGNGERALLISGCQAPGSVLISQNPNIRGGHGGDNFDIGLMATDSITGSGGIGTYFYGSNNVTIDQTTITGGDGGKNSFTPFGPEPGYGGEGIYLSSAPIPPFSNVTILSSTITGGRGGFNYCDDKQGGGGGLALYFNRGTGKITNTTLTGGKGGDNFGQSTWAGDGGIGFYAGYTSNMSLEGSTIVGGNGGGNSGSSSEGGSGGYAVSLTSDCDNISLIGNVNIIGGDGGDSSVDIGPGSAALYTILASQVTNISIIGNNISTGKGGRNASGDDWGINNSYCIRGTDMGGTNLIAGNNITTKTESMMDSTYGIWLASSSATVSDNDIYNNWRGILVYDTNNVTIGDNNRIFDNFIGITFQDSNGTIGSGNNISNNDYGIYCNNSNPMIVGDQVIGSNVSIYPDYFSSPKIINCTISSNPGAFDFAVIGDSHPWTLNTTFNKTAVVFGDPLSNLTVNWYLHVRVVDKSFIPEENADLWINDTYGTNLYYGQTPADGWIRWIEVTEYIEDQNGGKFYYTPFDISAVKDSRFGYELEDIDRSKEIIVVLKSKFSMPMKKGWNMISVPLNMTDSDLVDVLLDIDGSYKALQWFNANDLKDPWKHYHIDKGNLNDLGNIENTMGVWVYMNSDDILTVLGVYPDPVYAIELKSGWNFVGYPNLKSKQVGITPADAFFSIGGFVDMVMNYNASDLQDQWKAWDPGAQSPDDLVMIEPGMGLWIHVTGDCTWVINW